MAQQLCRQGEVAAVVALFTAPVGFDRGVPAPKSEAPQAKPASKRLATLMKSPLRVLYRKSARLVTFAHSKFVPTAYRAWLGLGFRIPPSMRTLYVWRTLLRAERNYVPKPYPGNLVLFHSSAYEDDPTLGWDGLAENLEHSTIGEGGQDSRRDLMDEPLVNQTAGELTL